MPPIPALIGLVVVGTFVAAIVAEVIQRSRMR